MEKKNKILLVDDELEFAHIVKLKLEKAGYEVSIAVDAYSGTREAIKGDYNLIILDLMMPAGDGFSILDRIHQFPGKYAIPVVILTGKKIDDAMVEKSKTYNVQALLSKHSASLDLLEKIKMLLPLDFYP